MSGENTKLVEGGLCIRHGREQLAKVALTSALGEEGNNVEKLSGSRAELPEHWGDRRKFDSGSEAFVVLRAEGACTPSLPSASQPVGIQLVMHNGCQQSDLHRVEVKLVQNIVDNFGVPVRVLVDAIKGGMRGLLR